MSALNYSSPVFIVLGESLHLSSIDVGRVRYEWLKWVFPDTRHSLTDYFHSVVCSCRRCHWFIVFDSFRRPL